MLPQPAFCRSRLTAVDLDFMAGCLAPRDPAAFAGWSRDPDLLDRMLDDPRLLRSLLEMRGCLRVSMALYFYVLVRHALRRSGADDPGVADYLASRLCLFASQERLRNPLPEDERAFDTLFEIWGEAERSTGERRFRLQVHLGDYALFLSGLFPRYLLRRVERRGAPGLEYFEQMGSASYGSAGRNGQAERLGMVPLLLTLCQAFHTARLALNTVAERLVFLDSEPAVTRLLRAAGDPG